ncbi:MAG: hypothetical protein NZ519_02085 [Bacteroidia bacterium]|nr:hypothetical protein [Bacteroidia bacterium]MDW8302468.1 hypothetical protein [Bacteroidia bacterium]
MKKCLLYLCFIALPFLAKEALTQVGQGLFVGGALGVATQSGKSKTKNNSNNQVTETETPKFSSFSIMPRVGYFVTDNIGVGLMLGYQRNMEQTIEELTNTPSFGVTTTRTTTTREGIFNVGLFGRYAQQLGEGDFYIYGDLSLGIASGSSKIEVKDKPSNSSTVTTKEEDGPKISVTSIGIAPGILYFPTKKIGLEASLGNIFGFTATKSVDEYTISNVTYTSEVRTRNLYIFDISSFSFNFGLNYYLNR